MDAAVITAIGGVVSGSLVLTGVALQVRAATRRNESETQLAARTADQSAASRVDEKLWKYVEQLESDRDKVREAAEKAAEKAEKYLADLRSDHLGLQALYEQTLTRLEILEQQRIKDQSMIQQLQDQVRRLENGST